jgi:hypothetical protein
MNTPQVEVQKGTAVDDKELIKAPAVYSNKFYLSWQKDGLIRLIFSDFTDAQNEAARVAVVMSIPMFMSFAQLVQTGALQVSMPHVGQTSARKDKVQ